MIKGKEMKLVINEKPYFICDGCGSFKSTERCYNCRPIQTGDLDIVPELRQYYNIPTQPSTALGVRATDISLSEISNGVDEDPEAIVLHHLMEYYFTVEQLRKLGLYSGVPEWQLLKVKVKNHFRKMGNWNLHRHLYREDWENYKNITEAQVRHMINSIPKKLIELYGEE